MKRMSQLNVRGNQEKSISPKQKKKLNERNSADIQSKSNRINI